MIMADLKHVGITAWLRQVIKMSVKTSFSSSLSVYPGMLSSPATLQGLILDMVFFKPAEDR